MWRARRGASLLLALLMIRKDWSWLTSVEIVLRLYNDSTESQSKRLEWLWLATVSVQFFRWCCGPVLRDRPSAAQTSKTRQVHNDKKHPIQFI